MLSSRTRRSSSRAAALLRAGGHDPRAKRYGARSILSTPLLSRGQGKAVTATAPQDAVLFYNTLRHGMTYGDPGADHYVERYRRRVLANLKRRAKSLGFVFASCSMRP